MQNTNKKQQGQSFIDMVIQQSGSFEEIINAAVLNDASLTDNLTIGATVINKNVINQTNVNLYKKQQPATDLQKGSDDSESYKGIGRMKISSTFKIG